MTDNGGSRHPFLPGALQADDRFNGEDDLMIGTTRDQRFTIGMIADWRGQPFDSIKKSSPQI